MLIVTVRRSWRRPESVEDQVSVNIGCVVQVSKPDLMVEGVAVDLFKMTNQFGTQCEAAEYEDLTGEKSLPQDDIVVDG